MKFPESWLREWCNPPLSSQALADTLTMGGFEVESMVPVAPPFSGVVVGEIMEAEQHPNADKLRICKVSAGAHTRDGLLQIVCGAPNARVGIRVPVALVGAVLPPATADAEPFNIKAATLRGIASSGMLCVRRASWVCPPTTAACWSLATKSPSVPIFAKPWPWTTRCWSSNSRRT
jgi:phenylalanyl-tRNA synthetase beta chain